VLLRQPPISVLLGRHWLRLKLSGLTMAAASLNAGLDSAVTSERLSALEALANDKAALRLAESQVAGMLRDKHASVRAAAIKALATDRKLVKAHEAQISGLLGDANVVQNAAIDALLVVNDRRIDFDTPYSPPKVLPKDAQSGYRRKSDTSFQPRRSSLFRPGVPLLGLLMGSQGSTELRASATTERARSRSTLGASFGRHRGSVKSSASSRNVSVVGGSSRNGSVIGSSFWRRKSSVVQRSSKEPRVGKLSLSAQLDEQEHSRAPQVGALSLSAQLDEEERRRELYEQVYDTRTLDDRITKQEHGRKTSLATSRTGSIVGGFFWRRRGSTEQRSPASTRSGSILGGRGSVLGGQTGDGNRRSVVRFLDSSNSADKPTGNGHASEPTGHASEPTGHASESTGHAGHASHRRRAASLAGWRRGSFLGLGTFFSTTILAQSADEPNADGEQERTAVAEDTKRTRRRGAPKQHAGETGDARLGARGWARQAASEAQTRARGPPPAS